MNTKINTLVEDVYSGAIRADNLISFCGERRRGKDYLAQALVEKHGAVRLSFSDEVRNLAQKIYPWFDAFGCDKDAVYDHPYNINKLTGRDILLNTGLVRNVDGAYFARKFVENQLPRVLMEPDTLFIITDFRTPEEYMHVLAPLQTPIMKIEAEVDQVKFPPMAFEEYIRNFNGYHLRHHNSMNGVDYFLNHIFPLFAGNNNVKGLK